MNQENRINFGSAQQSNDTILTISGVVLGFSIAFLSRAGTLGYSLLLKEAWAVFAIAILLNVFSRVVSPEPGFRPNGRPMLTFLDPVVRQRLPIQPRSIDGFRNHERLIAISPGDRH